ncbi:hypothetical protein FJZ21_01735 [Candidatus Pacearchaeota archaeon]|nr:hypothetical protein [Candidatus Pacearchaeota archaeon]
MEVPFWERSPTTYRDLSVIWVARDLSPHQLKIRPNSLQHAHLSLCPFHSENNPSAFFRPEQNTFTCYGCGRRGGAIYLAHELTGNALAYLESKNLLNRGDARQLDDLRRFLLEEESRGINDGDFIYCIFS